MTNQTQTSTALPTLNWKTELKPNQTLLERFLSHGALAKTFSNPALWRGMILERQIGNHSDPTVNNVMLTRLSIIEQSLRDGKSLEEIPEFLDWLAGTQIWPQTIPAAGRAD